MYFSGFPLVNYLPRFFLAGLLIFAGAGFVVENLWDARLTLSVFEYATVWVIVIFNVFAGLLPAIFIGIVLSAIIFSVKASRTNVIKFAVTRKAYQSKVVRSPFVEAKLRQLGDQIWIMKLQGFIFFGTVSRLLGRVKQIEAQRNAWQAPEFEMVNGEWKQVNEPNTPDVEAAYAMKYLILDFESVSDMDASGMMAFSKLQRMTKEMGVTVLFTDIVERLQFNIIDQQAIVSRKNYLNSVDEGCEYAEEMVLQWAADVRSNWYRVPQVRKLMRGGLFAMALDAMALRNLFPRNSISVPELMAYCQTMEVTAGQKLLTEGERVQTLYIVVSGFIKSFSSYGTSDAKARHVASVGNGAFLNENGFCLNLPADATSYVDEDAHLIALEKSSFDQMVVKHPQIAVVVQTALLNSVQMAKDRLSLEIRALTTREQDEIEDEFAEMNAGDLFSKDGLHAVAGAVKGGIGEAAAVAGHLGGTVVGTVGLSTHALGGGVSSSSSSPSKSTATGESVHNFDDEPQEESAMENPLGVNDHAAV